MYRMLKPISRMMRAHGEVRRYLHLASAMCVIAIGLIAVLASYKARQLDWMTGIGTGAFTFLGLVPVLYNLLDANPAELVDEIRRLAKAKKRARKDIDDLERNSQWQREIWLDQSAYSEAVNQFVTSVASISDSVSTSEQEDRAEQAQTAIADILDSLVAAKEQLLGIVDDRWTFNVYLPRGNRLEIYATRRWLRTHETQAHRTWASGEGFVGHAYKAANEVCCANTDDTNVKQYLRVSNKNVRDYDNQLYITYVAIPIRRKPEDKSLGILIATSDREGQFPGGQTDETAPQYQRVMPPLRFAAARMAAVVKSVGHAEMWSATHDKGDHHA